MKDDCIRDELIYMIKSRKRGYFENLSNSYRLVKNDASYIANLIKKDNPDDIIKRQLNIGLKFSTKN